MMLWSLKTHETSKFYIVRESMHTLLMLRQDISKFGNVFLTPHPASKQQIFLNGIKVFIIQGNISLSHPLLSDFTKVSASRLCHWPNVGTVGVDFCLWGQQPWLWAGAPTNPVLCWVTTCKRSWKAVEDSGPAPYTLCPNCCTHGCCELVLWELPTFQSLFGAPALWAQITVPEFPCFLRVDGYRHTRLEKVTAHGMDA